MQATNLHKCISCGNSFSGTYCNECGEKVIKKEEQKFSYFLGQIIDELAFWDTKFFKSLKLLLFKPGFLTREFMMGRRKIYTKPISLFFIANLLYFFFQPVDTLNSSFETQTKGQIYSSITMKMVNTKSKMENISYDQLAEKYDKKSPDNSRIFVLLIVFMFSLFLSILYWGKKRYYVEHLMFSFTYISAIIYTLFFLLPILLYLIYLALKHIFDYRLIFNINGEVISILLLSLIFLYLTIALKTFYRQKLWITIIKGVLLTISSVIIILSYKFILFFITMLMI